MPAARDFELAWTPDAGAAPAAALFTETKGGKTYALLMALPPAAPTPAAPRPPREVTYVIDTSGSMEGVSITQAREALALALDRLQPGDRFNVIEFNSVTHSLFAAPVPVDPRPRVRAKRFVGGLRARGGTEMLPALEVALAGERERVDDAPGGVPHRRRGGQRGRDPAAHRRARSATGACSRSASAPRRTGSS